MKIFISHDSKDNKEFIEHVTLELTQKGFDVYDGTSNIKPGEKIEKSLEILKECDAYICIVSKNSAQSIKMQIEYDSYVKNNSEINILPILIERNVELPYYIQQFQYLPIKNLTQPDNEIDILCNQLNKIKLKKPSVFICHSSKDKIRFVVKFIEDLKKFGVDPWYDDSEINSGSLIENIDKGIKNSNSGIIVFSKNLNDSKFALTEMNSLIHKSIYEDYKLIPIKIDNEVEVPELINHLQVIEIHDLDDYETKLNKILQMIFENKSMAYIKPIIKIPNCSKKDTEIFLELCKLCLDYGFDIELDPEDIYQTCKKYFDENSNITEEKIASSLKNLEKEEYLINKDGNVGRAFSSKRISQKGFCFYFKNFVDERENKYLKFIKAIFKDEKYSLDDLIEETNLERRIIEALIRIFRKHDYIACKNDLTILGITIEGKNYFKKIIGD